jgi:hypothetical protein
VVNLSGGGLFENRVRNFGIAVPAGVPGQGVQPTGWGYQIAGDRHFVVAGNVAAQDRGVAEAAFRINDQSAGRLRLINNTSVMGGGMITNAFAWDNNTSREHTLQIRNKTVSNPQTWTGVEP